MFVLKAVELDIQKIEAAQAKRHVQLLTAFLPETFVRRGGELFILSSLQCLGHDDTFARCGFHCGWPVGVELAVNNKAARVEVNISLAFLHWVGIALHP